MRRQINDRDRMILICSEASLGRSGLLNELQEILAREARDGGSSYLIPVRLDDIVLEFRQLRGRTPEATQGIEQTYERFVEAPHRPVSGRATEAIAGSPGACQTSHIRGHD